MNLIDALADGDVLKWDAVMYTGYNDVLMKLMMNKETTLYQRRYNKVMEQKFNKR